MTETADRKQYDVVVAEDGDSALEFIKTNHVDLVITDIKMPFMNGLELSRVLHSSFPSIKILIISGYNEFTLAQEAIEYQVKGFLLKPIKQEQLEQALTKLLIELDSDNDTLQASVPEHLKTMGKEEIAGCVEKYLKENFQKQISMGEISDMLGFDNPYYFSKVFKKNTGMWPSQYRAEGGCQRPE